MIIDIIVKIGLFITNTILAWLPNADFLPNFINLAIQQWVDIFGNFLYLLPSGLVDTILILSGLALVVFGAIFLWGAINWILNRIPFI